MDSFAPARPSYAGLGIDYPERMEAQPIDDIRTNLTEKFLSLDASDPDADQKASSETKEHMCVYLRVRPFTTTELEQNESQDCVSIQDSSSVLVKAPQSSLTSRLSEKGNGPVVQKFTFTQVFGPETSQSQFFEGTIRQNVIDFMEGQNRLIFTYGVTNAGKTFTFQGTKTNEGILPRSMNMLFNTIKGNVYSKMDLKPHRCRDYIRLTKEQMKTENGYKNTVIRQIKEVDPQCSMKSNSSKASADSTDLLSDEVIGGFENSSTILSEFEERLRQSEEFRLNVGNSVKFSVWVSFCEIYNECIYDLLDHVTADKFYKRKTLRLAQDIKGFSFVKDLQWINVSDAKEACKILAMGKKFQSIANTKLNSSSSRSHSIFTVRLLRIEDSDIPRVVKVSELALCDLAGSERCTKTHNEGERLKESGNINTSLLILGKCINALKTNSQHLKNHQHVPFRESKLTHYLQSFFSGKGKVSMIVNICQSASAYDETLNVLKFSAVAQKVLILDVCPVSESISQDLKKSAREVSFIINNADNKMWLSRKRATVHWDSRLEGVVEDGDDENFEEDFEGDEEPLDCTHEGGDEEEEEEEEEESDDIIIAKEEYQKLLDIIEDLKTKLVNEKKDKLVMELKIREEVAKDFSQLFLQRENDYSERLEREKELMQDRCDERLEIFQDLVKRCSMKQDEGAEETKSVPKETETTNKVSSTVNGDGLPLEGLISSVQSDLAEIKKQAIEAQLHISSIPDPPEALSDLEQKLAQVASELSKTQEELIKRTSELESQIDKCSSTTLRLEEADKKLSSQRQQIDELLGIIRDKESAIERLKDLVAHWETKSEEYDTTVNNIKGEIGKINYQKENSTEKIVGKKTPTRGPTWPRATASFKERNRAELIETNITADQKQITVPCEEQSTIKELKAEKEQHKEQIISLKHDIALLEEKLAKSDKQVVQMKSKMKNMESELQRYINLNYDLEGSIKILRNEVDQNKVSVANEVAQIRTIQNKLDEFGKSDVNQSVADLKDLIEESSNVNLSNSVGKTKAEESGRESTFYSAIEGLWKECQKHLQESTEKNRLIQQFKEQLDNLNSEITLFKSKNENLQRRLDDVRGKDEMLKEKDDLIVQLQDQLSKSANLLEQDKNLNVKSEEEIIRLKNEICDNKQKIKELESLLGSYKDKCEKLSGLEELNKDHVSAVGVLEKQLEEIQTKHTERHNNFEKIKEENLKLEQKIVIVQDKCTTVERACVEKEKQMEESKQEIKRLKNDLSQQAKDLKSLQLDLQRKDEDYSDLKDKLADAKKQIQQVEKEVSGMREEKKHLSSKICEYEKLKNQMSSELEMKQRTIQRLKRENLDNEKSDESTLLYQKACQDVQAKEKIIEDMRLTLIEQEQTQIEQDQALEAKVEEAQKLLEELEEWKHKCMDLKASRYKDYVKENGCEKNDTTDTLSAELSKLQVQLKEIEEKQSSERKKWFEEKMNLIAQAKESETHRNREMRRFADDRERYIKQQTEMEQLTAQFAEKDNTLQKWREERDQLVSALEVQLKSLLSSNIEKEKEIENLKKGGLAQTEENSNLVALKKQLNSSEETIKELQCKLAQLEHCKVVSAGVIAEEQVKEQTEKMESPEENNRLQGNKLVTKHSTSSSSSVDESESQDASDNVLDSSAISTENGKTSRFPKPELEIQFSPVKPNKFAIKHHGDDSPVTVKITRTARKRKSHEMEQNKMLSPCWKLKYKERKGSEVFCQEVVKTENKRNEITKSSAKTPSQSSLNSNNNELKKSQQQSLKKQTSTLSTMSRKKEATLQKLGDFIHSSPSIFHNKAKKLLETISSPKPVVVGAFGKENETKPKRNRRKLYTTDISVPLDIPIHQMVVDNNEKESDHLIMKRRLRTRTAK
ncbi:kinesin-like protein KIF20B [Discoglossus pictus]